MIADSSLVPNFLFRLGLEAVGVTAASSPALDFLSPLGLEVACLTVASSLVLNFLFGLGLEAAQVIAATSEAGSSWVLEVAACRASPCWIRRSSLQNHPFQPA